MEAIAHSRPGRRGMVRRRRAVRDVWVVICEACHRTFEFHCLADALLAGEAHKALERRRYHRKMRELRRRWAGAVTQ